VPEKCSLETIYRYWNDQALLRTQQQNKCVELSLQITTVLAAGIFAVMFREAPTNGATSASASPPTHVFWISVIVPYTMLQLLILANYLYHTFVAISTRQAAVELELSHPDVKHINDGLLNTTKRLNCFQTINAWIVYHFQPAVIYVSALIGSVMSLAFARNLSSSPTSFCLRGAFVTIAILFLCVLLYMFVVHLMRIRLAEGWTRRDIVRREKRRQGTKPT
jgi:small-conductance mechanosensitive channel